MRPYLAIIRDSFHEALASRVLWILLAITTVVLLGLVPLGFIEQAGSYLSDDDFLNREKLVATIVAQGKSGDPSPGRRIWEFAERADTPVDGSAHRRPVERSGSVFARWPTRCER